MPILNLLSIATADRFLSYFQTIYAGIECITAGEFR